MPLKDAYPYLPKFLLSIHAVDHRGRGECRQSHRWCDSWQWLPDELVLAGAKKFAIERLIAERLKIPHLTHEIKELSVLATTLLSAGTAFLKYNAPPALIYMGDLGALTLGSMVSAMGFCQSGIVPADCGRDFIFSVLSSIIQPF